MSLLLPIIRDLNINGNKCLTFMQKSICTNAEHPTKLCGFQDLFLSDFHANYQLASIDKKLLSIGGFYFALKGWNKGFAALGQVSEVVLEGCFFSFVMTDD